MKVICLMCEKKTDEWVGLEGNFAVCRDCYFRAEPFMVKAEIQGKGDELLCPKKLR